MQHIADWLERLGMSEYARGALRKTGLVSRRSVI